MDPKSLEAGEISATATIVDNELEGLTTRSLNEVLEPVDPRISPDDVPHAEELDEGLYRQMSNLVRAPTQNSSRTASVSGHRERSATSSVTEKKNDVIYVEFEEGDRRNPINFSNRKKWAITALACFSTLLASSTSSTYSMGYASMTRDLNCTEFQATIGLSTYVLGFAVVPLVTASLSEEFGRMPLYVISGIGFIIMYLMVALSKNIQTVIIARFLQAVLDLRDLRWWGYLIFCVLSDDNRDCLRRGLPMALFALMAVGGNGIGPFVGGWIEANPKLEWRWIQWIQMIICALYVVLIPVVLRETRASVMLAKMAKKIRKRTGDNRYRARVEDERASLKSLILISCTRPVYLMVTEMVVLSFSVRLSLSISGIFHDLHNFTIAQIGCAFITMSIGALIGFASNFYQEHLYRKNFPTRGPEARLYSACFVAILLPISMFIYAWCSFSHVHWISLCIAITIFVACVFHIYLAVFSYLADCLARNISGTVFPLFTHQMYARLSYKWANTLFGCLACLMAPIPFVLFFYGPKIRSKSKFSRMVMEASQKK
ncbi:MFS general substrate transporter [Cyathus striatus]|nr:MFS general substrate transporter [Cyathus striatus]